MTTDINPPARITPGDQPLSDLMLGAKTIAQFINTLFEGEPFTERDVWNWCAYGKIPHSKHGAQIVASKVRIRQHFYAAPPDAPPKSMMRPVFADRGARGSRRYR